MFNIFYLVCPYTEKKTFIDIHLSKKVITSPGLTRCLCLGKPETCTIYATSMFSCLDVLNQFNPVPNWVMIITSQGVTVFSI